MRQLIIVLLLAILAGCSETILLSNSDGHEVASGTLQPGLTPPDQLTVVLDGKAYTGNLSRKEVGNTVELRKRFDAGSKQYEAISSGLEHAYYHVHHYRGTLRAQDGSALSCDYLSSNDGKPLGTCTDDKGRVYEVHAAATHAD